jgi:hypothetical protein
MSNKTKAISMSAHAGYGYRVRLFWVLVALSVLLLSVYIYAINTTARNIAMRQDLERQIAEVSASLDPLEFAYIELRNNVTMDLAYEYGFKETRSPLYVSRVRAGALSFNTLDR